MKKLLLPRIPLFSTKKRSFDLFWIYLAFISIALSFIGVLTIGELSRARILHLKFFNLQSVNYSFLRTEQVENEVFLKSQSPLFVFDDDRVLIGAAAELTYPRPGASIVSSSYANWAEELLSHIGKGKISSDLFNQHLVGVTIFRKMSFSERVSLLAKIRSLIVQIKPNTLLNNVIPTIVFVQPSLAQKLMRAQ